MSDDALEREISRLVYETHSRATADRTMSGNPDGLIDLDPAEWTSDRPPQRGPFPVRKLLDEVCSLAACGATFAIIQWLVAR